MNNYFDNINKAQEILQKSEHISQDYADLVKTIEEIVSDNSADASLFEKDLIRIIQTIPMNDLFFIYILSVMVTVFGKSIYLELLLESILYSESLGYAQKKFILYQAEWLRFANTQMNSDQVLALTNELYNQAHEYLKTNVKNIEPLAKNEREKKVVIFVEQLLGERHAPTKMALSRAVWLMEHGYEVKIVVSAENHYDRHPVLFYDAKSMAITEHLNNIDVLEYKDHYIWYYQETKDCNTVEGVTSVINSICSFNPALVLYVGVRSSVADLLNDYIPVATIPTVIEDNPIQITDYMITNSIYDNAIPEIIPMEFVYEIPKPMHHFTKSELKVPEDKFCIAVVGRRLENEVTNEFIECLSNLNDTFVIFIGIYDSYDAVCEKNEWIKNNSILYGSADDLAGVLEACDLFVNPKRAGGGTSALIALSVGCPVVTINFGDVASHVDEQFKVDDYADMRREIVRYQTDGKFYSDMVEIGKEVARKKDSNGEEFVEVIDKLIDRI